MKRMSMIVLMAIMILSACQKEIKTTNATVKNNTTGSITKAQTTVDLSGAAGINMSSGNTSNFAANFVVLKSVPLIAGQVLTVGNVTVANDDEFVYVSYNVTLPLWRISELHLYLGDSTEIPANNSGNPIPGQFPNKITFKRITVNSYTFVFPRADFDETVSVAAHCVVNGLGSETAWGEGSPFPNADQWGMYFNVALTPVGPPKG